MTFEIIIEIDFGSKLHIIMWFSKHLSSHLSFMA